MPGTRSSRPRRGASTRAALAACLLAGFATLFDSAAIAYATPAVSASLGGGTAGVQALLASFSLTFGLGLVPAGRLGDAYGRRALFAIGLGIFLVGGIVTVLAPGIGVLIAARLLQGLGAGVISAQVLGAIQDLFIGPARLRALGLYTGVGALAALVGPLGAGAVLAGIEADLAWRIVLLLPLPFAAVAVRLGLRGLPGRVATEPGSSLMLGEVPPAEGSSIVGTSTASSSRHRAIVAKGRPRRRTPLDLPGIVLLCGLVVLLMAPVLRTGTGVGIASVLAPLGAGAAGIVLLIVWELVYQRGGRLPLFARDLVRSRGFVAGNLAAMLWFGSTLSLSSVLTIHLLTLPGGHPLLIALLFAPGALARLVASLLSARVHGALGPWAIVVGLALQTALLTTLALLAPRVDGQSLLVLAAVALVGLGFAGGVIEPPLRVVTLSFAPAHLHGVAASFLQLTQRLSATYLVALTTGILLGAAGAGSEASLGIAVATCAIAAGAATLVGLDRSLRRTTGQGRSAPVSGISAERARTLEASTATVS